MGTVRSSLKGVVMRGTEFNQLYHMTKFVKLTNSSECHNAFQFNDGLNIDTKSFDPYSVMECYDNIGGIYFVEKMDISKWIHYNDKTMCHVREVLIPDDAFVHINDGKFKTNKMILGHKKHIDDEVYLNSVVHYYENLSYIPRELVTKKLCLETMKIHKNAHDILKYIPVEIIDKEICLEAIKKNSYALQYVPEHLKDKEICMAALMNTIYCNVTKSNICDCIVVKLVHRKEFTGKDKNSYMEIIKQLLSYMPYSVKDEEIYMEVIRLYGDLIKIVPVSMMNYDMCLIAIKQNGALLEHILSSFKYFDSFEESNIPDIIKNGTICLEAVRQNGLALKHVPYSLRNKKICIIAIIRNGLALQYVPMKLIDEKLCIKAIRQNDLAIKYVPKHLEDKIIEISTNQQEIKYQYPKPNQCE